MSSCFYRSVRELVARISANGNEGCSFKGEGFRWVDFLPGSSSFQSFRIRKSRWSRMSENVGRGWPYNRGGLRFSCGSIRSRLHTQ